MKKRVKGTPHWDNIRKNAHRIQVKLISNKYGGIVSVNLPFPDELTPSELERFMKYLNKLFIRKWNPSRRYKNENQN